MANGTQNMFKSVEFLQIGTLLIACKSSNRQIAEKGKPWEDLLKTAMPHLTVDLYIYN